MDLPDDIEPSIRAALMELASRGLVTPDPAQVGIVAARRVNEAYFGYIAEPMPEIARTVRVSIVGETGPLDLKLVFPDATASGTAILYFHGGGFAFASLHTHERLMRRLARASGAVVVGVEYRRTPEHAYPAALLDAQAAWHWLIAGGRGSLRQARRRAGRRFGGGQSRARPRAEAARCRRAAGGWAGAGLRHV
jgi:acetyl esterase